MPIAKKLIVGLSALLGLFFQHAASALPAFARREKAACIMCHVNSTAPHLNELGYMYRRMAFHLPGRLGDEKSDEETVNATNHMAVGISVAYQYTEAKAGDGTKSVSANGVSMPEIQLWPLVGGFFGNFGTWSEVDASPMTNAGGEIGVSQADIRYAFGAPHLFYNFRGGLMAPEGYGASDQWLDDGNLPLMDKLAPMRNQETFVTPFGAMGSAELGIEAGLNYEKSHLTLGAYNGWTDVNINADGTPGTQSGDLRVAQLKHNDKGMRDYRVQLDQLVGDLGAVTAGYYHGTVPLTLPNDATNFWLNHFDQARLYLTSFTVPGKLDLFAGGAWAKNQYVSTTPNPDGTFTTKGGFVGANYYVMPHMTASGRLDRFEYNSKESASGYSLQLSFPHENTILILHFNHAASAQTSGPLQAGWNNDFGAQLRFLL